MNLTEQEIEKLKATKNKQEWNDTCDEIKKVRGRQYPPDWYVKILASGLAYEIQNSWSA